MPRAKARGMWTGDFRKRASGSARCCGAAGSGRCLRPRSRWRWRRRGAGAASRRLGGNVVHTATITVTLGKIPGCPHRPELRRHRGRRSGCRGRQPADRSFAVHSRQEDRHDAGHRLWRRTRSRSASSTSRCPTTSRGCRREIERVHRRRHQGVLDQRPHHAERHGAGRRHARQGGDDRAAVRARIRSTP